MADASTKQIEPRLTDISKFTYGTTRLGDEKIPFADRVKTARVAMDAGVWFHTSDQYGTAMSVLKAAFDEDRAHTPPIICKIGWSSIDELRNSIRKQMDAIGVERLSLGQLCLGGDLVEEFRSGGACYDGFQKLKDEGIVERFVVEVFPWTSQAPLEALQAGYPDGVIDGFIFYLNPLQRFAANELWDLIAKRNASVIAMRTVSGGDVHRLRDVPGAAWKQYLHDRAVEVAPLYERSGCKSWTEFCVRFAYGFPQVRSTVGSSARIENLNQFLDAVKDIQPLPGDIQSEVIKLQYRWSDETDVHAEPWSM
jgi:predicted aldo/keto reductase-like oxidoreductase